jgi:hypothetical protein
VVEGELHVAEHAQAPGRRAGVPDHDIPEFDVILHRDEDRLGGADVTVLAAEAGVRQTVAHLIAGGGKVLAGRLPGDRPELAAAVLAEEIPRLRVDDLGVPQQAHVGQDDVSRLTLGRAPGALALVPVHQATLPDLRLHAHVSQFRVVLFSTRGRGLVEPEPAFGVGRGDRFEVLVRDGADGPHAGVDGHGAPGRHVLRIPEPRGAHERLVDGARGGEILVGRGELEDEELGVGDLGHREPPDQVGLAFSLGQGGVPALALELAIARADDSLARILLAGHALEHADGRVLGPVFGALGVGQ